MTMGDAVRSRPEASAGCAAAAGAKSEIPTAAAVADPASVVAKRLVMMWTSSCCCGRFPQRPTLSHAHNRLNNAR
jgi:hypothetical protein